MFRVLNEDEARRVVRWKAPDIRPSARPAGTTTERNRPRTLSRNSPVTPVLRLPAEQSATESDGALSGNGKRGQTAHDPVYRPAPGHKQAGSRPRSGHTNKPAEDHVSTELTAPGSFTPLYSPAEAIDEEHHTKQLQTARDEGYRQGYEDGLAALQAEQISQVTGLLNSLRGTVEDYRHQSIEQEVLALSVKVGELLVRHELQVNPDALYQLVCLGLEQLPQSASQPVSVHLSPEDAQMLHRCNELDSELKIVAESGLNQGQCRIESGASIVYAGVDEWLCVLAEQLGLGRHSPLC